MEETFGIARRKSRVAEGFVQNHPPAVYARRIINEVRASAENNQVIHALRGLPELVVPVVIRCDGTGFKAEIVGDPIFEAAAVKFKPDAILGVGFLDRLREERVSLLQLGKLRLLGGGQVACLGDAFQLVGEGGFESPQVFRVAVFVILLDRVFLAKNNKSSGSGGDGHISGVFDENFCAAPAGDFREAVMQKLGGVDLRMIVQKNRPMPRCQRFA